MASGPVNRLIDNEFPSRRPAETGAEGRISVTD